MAVHVVNSSMHTSKFLTSISFYFTSFCGIIFIFHRNTETDSPPLCSSVMALFVAALLLVLLKALNCLEVLDLTIDGLPSRIYPNVSLGLRFGDDSTCKWKTDAMTYTPNRRLQEQTISDASLQRLQMAVVLVVGGHSDRYYDYGPSGSINGLMAVWDSWLEFYFTYTSNTTSLVLLFDERDFKKQNYTKSTHTYLDNILIHNMGAEPVDCVHLRHRPGGTLETVYAHQIHHRHAHTPLRPLPNSPHASKRPGGRMPRVHRDGCTNELPLDQTYRVYYIDVADPKKNSINQKPLIIYAAVHKFPLAEWVKPEEEENLFKTWKPWRLPGRFPTNYAYVKYTNWYSYHMLNLQLLDFFDYAAKLDNDVSFVAPFPEPNLPLRLAAKGTKMLVTQNGWYYDDPRVAQGVHQCLNAWISEQNKLCKSAGLNLYPRGKSDPTFWESNLNATFRAHFLTFWLGLYTAPETYSLARFWNDWHPRGMWDYRWGDQQWWPRPISMFGLGNVALEIDHYDEINTDNNKYLVHKLWPRYGTIAKGRYFNESGSTRQDRDAIYAITSKPLIY